MKHLYSFFMILCFVLISNFAQAFYNFGGEVPWPLANQHVVTVQNSRGLWKLGNKTSQMLFNVEIVSRENGYDWIRVSELHPTSYRVLSWGEGFFRAQSDSDEGSSFSDIHLEKGKIQDRYGRYIYMFPNGDLAQHPYVIRLVEVETTLGTVLGLSIISLVDKEYEHYLGTRIHAQPMKCEEAEEKTENLSCFLP